MSIKDELLKFRTKLTGATEVESTLIDLDAKVDEFIDWYFKNMLKGNYTDIGEYNAPREMRDLIEKIYAELNRVDEEESYIEGLDPIYFN